MEGGLPPPVCGALLALHMYISSYLIESSSSSGSQCLGWFMTSTVEDVRWNRVDVAPVSVPARAWHHPAHSGGSGRKRCGEKMKAHGPVAQTGASGGNATRRTIYRARFQEMSRVRFVEEMDVVAARIPPSPLAVWVDILIFAQGQRPGDEARDGRPGFMVSGTCWIPPARLGRTHHRRNSSGGRARRHPHGRPRSHPRRWCDLRSPSDGTDGIPG